MRVGSLCSGIEAASVAWAPLGWQTVFTSEIAAFPAGVLAHHYPDVPNLGDMTRYREWPDADLDLLVGGTPCQSFSVAGLRQGMADPRGNLALVYLGVVDRYRPRWVVWENVPGVLSSHKGRDFGAFLGALAELGYGWAYRVLDAEYVRVDGFGRAVPQRRRRVFVVGYSGDWRRAAAVLFDRESLHGRTPPRRTPGEGVAPTLSARTQGGGGLGTDFDCDGGLIPAVSPAMKARDSKGPSSDGCDDGLPLIPVAIDLKQVTSKANRSVPGPVSPTLHQDGTVGIVYQYAVRRLMPVECERLMGFPDGYTLIPYGKRGRPAKDGPRYKALGNSMAVNCMRWLGTRIQMVEDAMAEATTLAGVA